MYTELSTQEKILAAAAKIFTEKGYDGARTRDIAREADINLALLNYHFKTKEKLFQQVMKSKVALLFGQLIPIITNETSSLEEKIDAASALYFEILSENPSLPIFVLSELQKNNSDIKPIFPLETVLQSSAFIKQIQAKKPEINPFHFLINFLGMTVFPFIMKPVITSFGIMNNEAYQTFVTERKKMIPQWIKQLLND